jgi:hypothetical protein
LYCAASAVDALGLPAGVVADGVVPMLAAGRLSGDVTAPPVVGPSFAAAVAFARMNASAFEGAFVALPLVPVMDAADPAPCRHPVRVIVWLRVF